MSAEKELPVNVCNTIANMTPLTQVQEIVEYVHYIVTEEEMKMEDGMFTLFEYLPNSQPDRSEDMWSTCDVTFDTEILLVQGQQRNIISFWCYSPDVTTHTVELPARELRQIDIHNRCLRVAQLIHQHILGLNGEYEIIQNNRRRALPEMVEERQHALMEINHEENLRPSVLKQIHEWFSKDDVTCLSILMPIITKFVANAETGFLLLTTEELKTDQTKTEKSQIVSTDDLTFSKLMEITGISPNNRGRSFDTILSKFAGVWDDEIVAVREGLMGRYGKPSEIVFTLQGFLLAFTCLNDKMSRKITALQAKITAWALTNIAHKMNEQNVIMEQIKKENKLNAKALENNVKLQTENSTLEKRVGKEVMQRVVAQDKNKSSSGRENIRCKVSK